MDRLEFIEKLSWSWTLNGESIFPRYQCPKHWQVPYVTEIRYKVNNLKGDALPIYFCSIHNRTVFCPKRTWRLVFSHVMLCHTKQQTYVLLMGKWC